MSAEGGGELQPETGASRPKPFRRKPATSLSPEALRRQGRITTEAFLALGRDAAVAFLNAPDPALGGRPLDIALASAEGEAKVASAIQALTKPRR